MKNFQTVSDSELLNQIRSDAHQERHAGLQVIHQLREISRRRLYSTLGYDSLHKYCMEDLKYSPASASRRIASMEALEDLPELENKIADGELTLANLSQIQSFCQRNDKTVEEKKDLLEQCSGLSKRETEKKLAAIAPQPEKKDKRRELDGKKTELRITLDAETVAALDRMKDWMAHSLPQASYSDVITRLARLGLKKLDPAAEPSRKSAGPKGAAKGTAKGTAKNTETNAKENAEPSATKCATQPMRVPEAVGSEKVSPGNTSPSPLAELSGKETGESVPTSIPKQDAAAAPRGSSNRTM